MDGAGQGEGRVRCWQVGQLRQRGQKSLGKVFLTVEFQVGEEMWKGDINRPFKVQD